MQGFTTIVAFLALPPLEETPPPPAPFRQSYATKVAFLALALLLEETIRPPSPPPYLSMQGFATKVAFLALPPHEENLHS